MCLKSSSLRDLIIPSLGKTIKVTSSYRRNDNRNGQFYIMTDKELRSESNELEEKNYVTLDVL